MLYFKNTELAETYHVSLRTVLNWIDAVKQGKMDLSLYETSGRTYIANTTKNVIALEKLVEERKKYRNTRGFKVITPDPKLYDVFTREQLFDIISNIEIHHEIPRQFDYFEQGADEWDKYVRQQAATSSANTFTSTIKLLETNRGYIDHLLSPYKRVNVFDVGIGNAMPIRPLLEYLLEKGIMGRYVGLDISPRMLDIASSNIKEWFGDRVEFEAKEIDITYDRFADLLAEESVKNDPKETVNLIVAFGDTLGNLRSPKKGLDIIQSSLGRDDLLFYATRLDTPRSRRFFDFINAPSPQLLPSKNKLVVDLLNIDESYYDVEMGYDRESRMRFIRIRLKVALSIRFDFGANEARRVDLNKDDTILVWRYWHRDTLKALSELDRSDLDLVHASTIEDGEFLLAVAKLRLE